MYNGRKMVVVVVVVIVVDNDNSVSVHSIDRKYWHAFSVNLLQLFLYSTKTNVTVFCFIFM